MIKQKVSPYARSKLKKLRMNTKCYIKTNVIVYNKHYYYVMILRLYSAINLLRADPAIVDILN